MTAEELVAAQLYTGIFVVEDLQKGKKDGRFFRVRLLQSLALHETPRDVIPRFLMDESAPPTKS